MKKTLLNNLESLPFFTKAAISALESIDINSLNQNVKRWVNSGSLIRLKNGLYVTKTFVDRTIHDASYIELIANKLVMPSYLSLEYVMQKFNLLTEATFSITSVTLKSTRKFVNVLGTFKYQTVNKDMYFGFKPRRFGRNIIYEASPAKAVFDYLYLRSGSIDPNDLSTIEELRINWNELDKKDFAELLSISKRCGIKKIMLILRNIGEHIYGDAY